MGSGAWIVNAGTKADPVVVASSGAVEGWPAWQAADGVTAFSEAQHEGWNAVVKCSGVTPNASSTPVVKDWKWDGVNGNNAVWVGSSAAGVRLFLKGPEDEWQAAVPYDSRATPPLPPLWSAGGGGITLLKNGTVTGYTGLISTAGRTSASPLVLRFSLVATPVRPLNLTKHFASRYAQLGGPASSEGGSIFRVGVLSWFRQAHHTCRGPTWGCIARAGSQTESS